MVLKKRHENLVCSVAIDMEHCTIHTQEPMERYAERVNADFHQITQSKHRVPHLAKYDLIIMAERMGYKRFLFLDSDIYIRRGVPNIFEHYTNALFNEMPNPSDLVFWQRKMFESMTAKIDPDFKIGDPYYNTGVMVFDKEGIKKLAHRLTTMPEYKIVEEYYEQHELNWILKQEALPDQNLSSRWNTYASYSDLKSDVSKDSYFVHVNGITDKDERSARLKRISEMIP